MKLMLKASISRISRSSILLRIQEREIGWELFWQGSELPDLFDRYSSDNVYCQIYYNFLRFPKSKNFFTYT